MLPAEFSIIATMRMPEATLPLQWDLFKIADGHIQYRLVVDGSNRSIRFTVSDNNKYEIIRAEDWFQNSWNSDVTRLSLMLVTNMDVAQNFVSSFLSPTAVSETNYGSPKVARAKWTSYLSYCELSF